MIFIAMVVILKPIFRMPLHFKLFLFLSFIGFSAAFAQDTQLSILAPDYTGQAVYLWEEDDYFTKHKVLLDEGLLETDQISFKLEADDVKRIRIGIDYQYATLYVQPGNSYTVSFPKHNPKDNRTLAWNTQVMLSFIDLPEDDINAKLMAYSAELDVFFTSLLYQDNKPTQNGEIDLSDTASYGLEIPANFSQRESLAKFKSFVSENEALDTADNSFLEIYEKYANASIAYSLGEKRTLLYDEYLNNSPVWYNNPEFALFFSDFYANYFDAYKYYPLSEKLKDAFSAGDVEVSLRKLIENDTQTGSKPMQELILIKGLYDYHFQHPEKDSIIIEVFNSIAAESAYKENRKIAANYLQKLSKGQIGSAFPDVELVYYTGDTLQLSSFKGQMIYLQLFASWSATSLAEMELMNELYKRYHDHVRFVSLSIDPDQEAFFEFVKANRNFKWDLGWIGVHPDALEQLSIYTIPLFYLIDADFNCAEWPALWPSTGIEQEFYEMELEQKEKDKFRFWDNQTNKSNREE